MISIILTAEIAQAVSAPTITLFSVTMSSYLRGSFMKTYRSTLINTRRPIDSKQVRTLAIHSTVSNTQNGPRPRMCLISAATDNGCTSVPTRKSVPAEDARRMLWVVLRRWFPR